MTQNFTFDDFRQVPGQIGRRSAKVLFSLQDTILDWTGEYTYLEIGSFAGRSLHPHVRHPSCTYALSVDLRPEVADDERGAVEGYDLMTADRMLENLRAVCGDAPLSKLECITGTSDDIGQRGSDCAFDLAFIDAEHTVRSAFLDFLNALDVMKPDAIIAFDDLSLVFPAVEAADAFLQKTGVSRQVVYTKNNIGLILLGAYAGRETQIKPRMIVDVDGARQLYFERIRAFSV